LTQQKRRLVKSDLLKGDDSRLTQIPKNSNINLQSHPPLNLKIDPYCRAMVDLRDMQEVVLRFPRPNYLSQPNDSKVKAARENFNLDHNIYKDSLFIDESSEEDSPTLLQRRKNAKKAPYVDITV
jgi:hypothetical protein